MIIRFLGGVHFAIALIATAALFVVAGTILESLSDSHLYAAAFTYNNPIFTGLLGLFFVNILISALRRWPFKRRHAPFLITHLGLLMILSGVIIKNTCGVQGSLAIWEGSGSHQITLAGTQAVEVEERDTKKRVQYRLNELKVLSQTPHAEPCWHSWIQGDQLHIVGLPPIPLNIATRIRLFGKDSAPWKLVACIADDARAAAQKLYSDDLHITIANRATQEPVQAETTLHFTTQPELEISCGSQKAKLDLSQLHLANETTPHIGSAPFTVDLNREPLIAFIKDSAGDVYLFAFDPHGRIHEQVFKHDSWSSIASFDEGFSGYGVIARIPFEEKMPSRGDMEQTLNDTLRQTLKSAEAPLSPPLEMLKRAAIKQNRDFAEVTIAFLDHWNKTNSWLYPGDASLPKALAPVFASLEWNPPSLKAAQWIAAIIPPIAGELSEGKDLRTASLEKNWPLVPDSLNDMAQQIFMVADRLPENDSIQDQSSLFSAYLRAYGIHYADILPEITIRPETPPTLESPMSRSFLPLPPLRKLEDNRPAIKVRFDGSEVALGYDPHETNLPWPTKSGKYLLRFGPRKETIPYHVRVRDARQINYANSDQPYSYECDAVISGVETTLSMNTVYETWDGYRFYLAAISPETPGDIQQVRIVVNRDPAKYWLTYPGAFILALGIILVFWFRKKLCSPLQEKPSVT